MDIDDLRAFCDLVMTYEKYGIDSYWNLCYHKAIHYEQMEDVENSFIDVVN